MEQNRPYDALKKMKTELFVYKESKDILNVYNEWAAEYEGDIDAIGYKIHDESAEVLLRHLKNNSETYVLDVLCGTGMVGMYLRQRGYKGTLHGVDGSEGMLEMAKKKSVYDLLKMQHLEPGGEKILGGKIAEYEGVTLVGGFLQGHLDPKLLPDLAELLKIGGYLVYTARVSADNETYRLPLEGEAKRLVETDVLREVEIVKTAYAVDWNVEGEDYSNPASKERTPSTVWIYCYQKI